MGKTKKAEEYFLLALERCPTATVCGCLDKVTAFVGLKKKEEAMALLRQTCEQFKIQKGELEEFFHDWDLLATSPEPPEGIHEFIEQAKAILSEKEKL